MNTSPLSISRVLGLLALTALLAACDGESASAPASTATMSATTGSTAASRPSVAASPTAKSTPAAAKSTTTTSSSSTPAPSGSDTASLSWTAPSENTDGSALTNLAGYTIYYGNSASDMSQQISIHTVGELDYVVQNLGSGTWFFEIVAVTSTGTQSAPSGIATVTI
jgi:hypothetical protein